MYFVGHILGTLKWFFGTIVPTLTLRVESGYMQGNEGVSVSRYKDMSKTLCQKSVLNLMHLNSILYHKYCLGRLNALHPFNQAPWGTCYSIIMSLSPQRTFQ